MTKDKGWSKENKGKPWTDDELFVVLSDAPTKYNCEKYARAFRRGYGSISEIYGWAKTSWKEIKRQRGSEKYVNQVKRVSKLAGWV